MVESQTLNEYIESYKQLPIQEKKELVREDAKELLAFINKACSDLKIENAILFNREIVDLNSDNISEDDFVEAMFVYILLYKESMGKYFNAVSKVLYK